MTEEVKRCQVCLNVRSYHFVTGRISSNRIRVSTYDVDVSTDFTFCLYISNSA